MSSAGRLGMLCLMTLLSACHAAEVDGDGGAVLQPVDVSLDGDASAESVNARVLALAGSGWQPELDVQQAMNVLVSAPYFATARTGRLAHPDPQAVAFVRVLVDATAATRFATLAADDNDCARLYGLCGLYLLDRATFGAAMERETAAHGSGDVMFWYGCFGTTVDVAQILEAPFAANADVSRGGLPLGLLTLAEDLSHEPSLPARTRPTR